MTTLIRPPRAVRERLRARDDLPFGYVEQDGDAIPWWYSETGVIVKWTIFAFIVLLIAALFGAYWHARHRLRRGLLPLRYHRWLVRRRARAQFDPNYGYPRPMHANYANHQPNGYPMYNMPPPTYYPMRPPVYEPPESGSKAHPAQVGENRPTYYHPPQGPPPAMR